MWHWLESSLNVTHDTSLLSLSQAMVSDHNAAVNT